MLFAWFGFFAPWRIVTDFCCISASSENGDPGAVQAGGKIYLAFTSLYRILYYTETGTAQGV